MKKAFLHSRMRRDIPTIFTTTETADALQKLGVTIDRRDDEWMPFEFKSEDYSVKGSIERWAGTESRIRLEGEISLPPHNVTLRSRLIAVTVTFIVIASVAFVTPLSIKIFGIDGVFTYVNTHLFVALLLAVVVCTPIVKLLSHDYLAQRRWSAQQALGNFVEKVAQISKTTKSSLSI